MKPQKFSDLHAEAAAKAMAAQAAATQELCAAFLSEHGCLPSEAEVVVQSTLGGVSVFIRKRVEQEQPWN